MESFVGKMTVIVVKKWFYKDSIFHNLHDFFVGTYWINIICYNYIIEKKKFTIRLHFYAPKFNKTLKSPKKMSWVELFNMKTPYW
jgi:hypothetical protein